MSKLKLEINSTDVLSIFGIVNITFNAMLIGKEIKLSSDILTIEYDVDLQDNNILIVDLLNDQAYDGDNDGIFDPLLGEDQTMQVTITSLDLSIDGINYISIIPSIEREEWVDPFVKIIPSIPYLLVWGSGDRNTTFTFTV